RARRRATRARRRDGGGGAGGSWLGWGSRGRRGLGRRDDEARGPRVVEVAGGEAVDLHLRDRGEIGGPRAGVVEVLGLFLGAAEHAADPVPVLPRRLLDGREDGLLRAHHLVLRRAARAQLVGDAQDRGL